MLRPGRPGLMPATLGVLTLVWALAQVPFVRGLLVFSQALLSAVLGLVSGLDLAAPAGGIALLLVAICGLSLAYPLARWR